MSSNQIEVRILNQEYRLTCPPESEAELRQAAARVDQEMHKAQGKTTARGTDRLAMMVALSLASELIRLEESVRHGEAFPAEEIQRTIARMNQQLESAVDAFEASDSRSGGVAV
jgi:cell division protein ZapA